MSFEKMVMHRSGAREQQRLWVLDMCEFTTDLCEDLALALTTCRILNSLNLDWITLDPAGMVVQCDALNHKDCNLKMLGWVHTVSQGQEWLQSELLYGRLLNLSSSDTGLGSSVMRDYHCRTLRTILDFCTFMSSTLCWWLLQLSSDIFF